MYRMKRKLFSLERIQFGPIALGKISRGRWRDLNASEMKILGSLGN
jgi:16S rRNA U516 pseudouridylate synthase RsuA-like enzyme